MPSAEVPFIHIMMFSLAIFDPGHAQGRARKKKTGGNSKGGKSTPVPDAFDQYNDETQEAIAAFAEFTIEGHVLAQATGAASAHPMEAFMRRLLFNKVVFCLNHWRLWNAEEMEALRLRRKAAY